MKKEGNVPYVFIGFAARFEIEETSALYRCFDNSNLQGSDAVASMVVFADGNLRKVIIENSSFKTVEGPDDFASMKEIISRRYSRVMEEKQPIPDLIMLTGERSAFKRN